MNGLLFRDYEQIVVADCPPAATIEQAKKVLEARDRESRKRLLAVPDDRHNNWGIAPAAAGLALASGRYVCFLSDDNGYTPDHLDPLVNALEREAALGFVYSSCRYDGRLILNFSPPRHGRIDLGQPLFRRHVLDRCWDGKVPFKEAAWDRPAQRLAQELPPPGGVQTLGKGGRRCSNKARSGERERRGRFRFRLPANLWSSRRRPWPRCC